MECKISPNATRSNTVSLSGHHAMFIFGFTSNILGLVIALENRDGSLVKHDFEDTTVGFAVDHMEFKTMWFEYSRTDKEYVVNLQVE